MLHNIKAFNKNIIKKQEHAFHLVDSSFLPFLSGTFLLIVLFNLLAYLHDIKFVILQCTSNILVQVIFIGIVLYWFNSITIESMRGFHTTKVQNGLRFGMLLFIVSEIMFFFAFFWAFFHFSIAGAITMGQAWPPKDTQDIDIMGLVLPVVNTTLLLSSGITITLAHDYILKGRQLPFTLNLFFTIFLGLFFLICQAYEYKYGLGFSWKEDIYGAGFFITTGFHGLHVTIGTIFLTYCLLRVIIEIKTHNIQNNNKFFKNLNCGFTSSHHFGFEAAAWYWHFVDVVWLFLFITIYWWGGYVHLILVFK